MTLAPRHARDARWCIHSVLTCMMAGIALQLFLPMDTFDSGGNWRAAKAAVTEDQLGCLCWAIACIGVLGLASGSRRARLATVVVLATAHGMLAGSFAWSNPAGIGSLLLAGYAFLGYYLVFRHTAEQP